MELNEKLIMGFTEKRNKSPNLSKWGKYCEILIYKAKFNRSNDVQS